MHARPGPCIAHHKVCTAPETGGGYRGGLQGRVREEGYTAQVRKHARSQDTQKGTARRVEMIYT